MKQHARWMVIVLTLVVGFMSLVACVDAATAVPATATTAPKPTATTAPTAAPPTATAAPPTATTAPKPTATTAPTAAPTAAPTQAAANFPLPNNDEANVALSTTTVTGLSKLLPAGQITAAAVVADDRDPGTLLDSYITLLKSKGWQSVKMSGQFDYARVTDQQYLAFLTKDGADLYLSAQPAASYPAPGSALTSGDIDLVKQVLKGHTTALAIAIGAGFANALVNSVNVTSSDTPAPSTTDIGKLDFTNDTYAVMSADTIKAVGATFPGKLTSIQVFGDTNNPQTLLESSIADLQKQGWTVVPIGGKPYTADNSGAAAVLTMNGVDIALTMFSGKRGG